MLLIFNLLQSGYYTTEPVASRYDAATMGMFVLIIVIGVIGYIVQARLQHVFKKYSEVPFPGGLTGAEVAEKMLRDNKIHNVKITHVSGQLTDHFNPQTMTVNLSDSVYSSTSVAAAAVAAHECGHAVQHARGYAPLTLRSQLVPIVQFSSTAATWVIILGLMAMLGIEFNIVTIILSTFIFGIGDDFSIFIMDGLLSEYKTGRRMLDTHKTAIFFSAFTVVVGLGALIFARHPALHSLALISLFGIVAVVLVSYTVQPVLFRMLVSSQTEKGGAPYTLGSLITPSTHSGCS